MDQTVTGWEKGPKPSAGVRRKASGRCLSCGAEVKEIVLSRFEREERVRRQCVACHEIAVVLRWVPEKPETHEQDLAEWKSLEGTAEWIPVGKAKR